MLLRNVDRTPVSEMRKKLDREVIEIGNEFVHILRHIGEIEENMRKELDSLIIAGAQNVCPVVKAFNMSASS